MHSRKFINTLDYHRSQPEVTLERHVRKRRIELGIQICSMYRIYLDLRYWILFREVHLGRAANEVVFSLLNRIRHLVESGRAVCPISDSVFVELLKQDDPATRITTANLVDQLSAGTTLLTHSARVRQELCNSLYGGAGAKNLIPIEQLVWTKLPSILGEVHPSETAFNQAEELVIQKAFYDQMWEVTLSEIVRSIDFAEMPKVDWEKTAYDLNEGIAKHSKEITSYKRAYRLEFEGGLSVFKNELLALFREIEESGLRPLNHTYSHLSKSARFAEFSRSIPTLHICACCHAAVRWDKKRKLSGNDLFDFQHAEAALPYCNLFLTEKSLKSLLSQKHLGLTDDFACKIVSAPREALHEVNEING